MKKQIITRAIQEDRKALITHLMRVIKEMKVKNSEIDRFMCYNTEGNIRMQNGYNEALSDIQKLLEEEL